MSLLVFSILLCACFAAATTGAMFPPGAWYDRLDKPNWTPPNWLFPVAWTTLYLAMSIAGARIAYEAGSGLAMAFWALQIALNTLWTPIFFGLRRIRAGLGIIVLLWLSVAACLVTHLSLDLWAGLLFVPYLIWVTTAAALNYSVMKLNPYEARNPPELGS